MFTWYWLADFCREEKIKFLLGHALYMKAINGGKKKDDKLDSEKIARLMRGGTFPLSYVYLREMRATRVLLYEIHTIDRFPSVGDFLSYARLVTTKQTSDGKVTGHGGGKIGNVQLKWAFSEAVLWMRRYSEDLISCALLTAEAK